MLKETKTINKSIFLKPVVNKTNGQITFSIKKSCLPIKIKEKLQTLKSIKLNTRDLQFK